MGIDRIGKGPPPLAPPSDKLEGGRAPEPAARFQVPSADHAATAIPSAAVDAVPRTPLDRWRAGEIDLHGYLDAKVEEATSHLPAMPAPELEAIRQALRDRMASDPTLADLVRTVTGLVPEPHSDP